MRINSSRILASLFLLGLCALSLAACKHSDSPSAPASAGLQKKWQLALGGRGDGGLALTDDGNIIAVSGDGYVSSVDSNGKLNWKTYIGPTHASPQVGSDGAIYIANDNGSVFALNRSGSQRWRSTVYEGNTLGHNAGVIGNSFLYVPSRGGLVAVNLSDGRVEWTAGIGTEQYGSVTQLSDGTLLFGSHGRLTAANSHGDILWQYPQPTEEALQRNGNFPPPGSFFVTSGIAPGPDRQLLLGMGHNQLAAIGQDATLRWNFDSRGQGLNLASPMVSSDGTIYFAHSDGHLYAFDSYGTRKWDFDMREQVAATPVLAADGTIFLHWWTASLCAFSRWQGARGRNR